MMNLCKSVESVDDSPGPRVRVLDTRRIVRNLCESVKSVDKYSFLRCRFPGLWMKLLTINLRNLRNLRMKLRTLNMCNLRNLRMEAP